MYVGIRPARRCSWVLITERKKKNPKSTTSSSSIIITIILPSKIFRFRSRHRSVIVVACYCDGRVCVCDINRNDSRHCTDHTTGTRRSSLRITDERARPSPPSPMAKSDEPYKEGYLWFPPQGVLSQLKVNPSERAAS